MRGSKFPADMHNFIWCPIYIPSFMIIGSVVSEELRWQDFGTDGGTDGRTDRRTDGRTDGRSDCTPRPAFAFGDAGNNEKEDKRPRWLIQCIVMLQKCKIYCTFICSNPIPTWINPLFSLKKSYNVNTKHITVFFFNKPLHWAMTSSGMRNHFLIMFYKPTHSPLPMLWTVNIFIHIVHCISTYTL